jgi:hypothetical protein
MVKVLLHIKSIFFCSLCDKTISDGEELGLISNAVIGDTEEWLCQFRVASIN